MSDAHREAFHAVVVQRMTPEAWAEKRADGTTALQVFQLLREVGVKVHAALDKRRKARRRRL